MAKYSIVHLPDDEPYRIWRLFPDTFIIHYGEALDTFLLLGEEKALLIDTAYGRGEFPNLVDACIGGRELIVVNTHGHYDHTGGNPFYPRVYMHENAKAYADRAFSPLDPAWVANMPYPNYEKIAVEDGHVFDLGGRKVEVLYTPAHCDSSLSFIDHGRRLLFSGDEFDASQANLNHLGSVRAFLANCKRLKEREADFDFIMPNHNGSPVEKGYLEDFITCAQHIVDGCPDTVSLKDLPGYMSGFWGDLTARAEVNLAAINYVPLEPEAFMSIAKIPGVD